MKRYIKNSEQIDNKEQLSRELFGSSTPGYGCSYICKDGLFINIYPKLDTHEDLCWYLEDHYDEFFEYADEEYFIREFGWVRLRTDPNMVIIELPSSMTNAQWYSLEDWLQFIEQRYPNGATLYLNAVDANDADNEYNLGKDYFAEDIIKICKRYYSSGRLY